MKFSAGYNPYYSVNVSSFSKLVCEYDDIDEIFFPFLNEPSGRPPVRIMNGKNDIIFQTFVNDLIYIKKHNKKLNLLLNSNCYGSNAISDKLLKHVDNMLNALKDFGCYPNILTTTSIHIAKYITYKYPDIERRASVTFDLHELQSMRYLSDIFDGFYLSLSKQRNINHVEKINNWCIKNNKKLCLLPNSSCIGNCPYIAYHANLVAHDTILNNNNIADNIPCFHIWNDSPPVETLRGVWIRPEDIKNYEGLCYMMKLTTRMHNNPKLVFDAYTTGKYNGNLLKIIDPYYEAFDSYYLDNIKFPENWFDITSKCDHDCTNCNYCEKIFKDVCYNV